MNSKLLYILPILSLLIVVSPIIDTTDAEDGTSDTYYCYGDSPILTYPYSSGDITVYWSAVDTNGNKVMCYPEEGKQTSIQLHGLDEVIVTQKVIRGEDSREKTIKLIGLHIFTGDKVNESYTVRFISGDSVISTQTVDRKTVVTEGKFHVPVPLDPVSDKYAFGGWFTDREYTQLFDPYSPIYDNTDVYAKWTGYSSTICKIKTHVVTFDAVNGIAYKIDRIVGSSIYFTVQAVPGYTVDLSSISVESTSGRITSLGGSSFLLDNVREDVTVTIDIDLLYSIVYQLSHMIASFGEDSNLPTGSFKGSFDLNLKTDFGWSSPKVTILMNGVDITDDCLDGEKIHIDVVSGNIVITASAELPWIYVVIVVIIVIAVVATAVILRSKSRAASNQDKS